jgi:hypothetical protein
MMVLQQQLDTVLEQVIVFWSATSCVGSALALDSVHNHPTGRSKWLLGLWQQHCHWRQLYYQVRPWLRLRTTTHCLLPGNCMVASQQHSNHLVTRQRTCERIPITPNAGPVYQTARLQLNLPFSGSCNKQAADALGNGLVNDLQQLLATAQVNDTTVTVTKASCSISKKRLVSQQQQQQQQGMSSA